MTIIDRETFLELPTADVAKLVREAGTKVCVFPINGTRRWFMLEHQDQNNAESYLSITWLRHIELYKLNFRSRLRHITDPYLWSGPAGAWRILSSTH